MLFQHARLFYQGEFKLLDLRIAGDSITEIGEHLSPQQEDVLDCTGMLLLPGAVEVHSHGCIGADFSTATAEEIDAMLCYYAKNGVTSVLGTTMTMKRDAYRQAARTLREAIEVPQNVRSRLLGINMEGPFLGAAKRGAHDEFCLEPIDAAYFAELDELAGGHFVLVDLDPDLDGAMEFIRRFSGTKKISLAHTACSYETALQAIDCGASHVTHLFNAMNGLHHRNPGIFGALNDRDIFAELIADGVHIHPAILRLMFTLCPEKLVLISDSMAACGLGDGEYELGGLTVYVKDSKAALADGTIAGSTCNVFDGMVRAINFGVPAEAAILAATRNPARAIGMDHRYGCLEVGYAADLVLTTPDYVRQGVWIGGVPIL